MNRLHASRPRHTATHLLFVPFCVLAACVVLLPLNPIGGATEVPRKVQPESGRPNIVLILTDDQTPYDLRWMPITRRLLGSAGMTFTRALSPHPLCCPARAELLTGQYAQNNGVQNNGGPYGGFKRLDDRSTIATWLQAAGYRTAFLGKYLNGYEGARTRQRGWDDWDALTAGVYTFRDFTLFNNRADQHAVFRHSYLTDVLTERADRTIRDFAATGDPFFVWISNVAPHRAQRDPVRNIWGPPLPAPRHEGKFSGAQPPSFAKPSFNEVEIADQPADLRNRAPADPNAVRHLFRERIRSLQAVDESVASLVASLDDVGELGNTWIFFVSDNGYSLGEHRYEGKNLLTSESMAVPLVVRGPGVAPGTWSQRPVTLVDLPVTFAAIAGARPTITVDGSPFLGLLTGHPEPWRDTQLVQTGSDDADGPAPGWAWRGVATRHWTYGRQMNTGERLLYDHATDPFELHNLAGRAAYANVVAELERRSQVLRDCSGASCNQRFGPVPGVRAP